MFLFTQLVEIAANTDLFIRIYTITKVLRVNFKYFLKRILSLKLWNLEDCKKVVRVIGKVNALIFI